ncbi:MAG TPA: DUF1349 domain-containing protein [Gaiellaceae bacterium]|nr:DUF1349 domain-containing protein [Gaiellaceae bacterium]
MDVRIEAGAKTDWFVDPGTEAVTANAPSRLEPAPAGDFMLSALVEAELRETFDAGALVVWANDRTWAKLALERNPEGRPTIVSVVTRGVSDDCNSYALAGARAWLRIARIGAAYAFHASENGERWQLIRHFRLDADGVRIGFESQSPLGEGCAATFSHCELVQGTLADLRDGS